MSKKKLPKAGEDNYKKLRTRQLRDWEFSDEYRVEKKPKLHTKDDYVVEKDNLSEK